MKKHLSLLLLSFVITSLSARINLCVVNVSHARVVLAATSGDSYIAHVPQALSASMQVICDDKTLYINESQACPDQTIKVAVPLGTALELNGRQMGQVVVEQVSGPVTVQLHEKAGVSLQQGHCPTLRVTAQAKTALVSQEVRVGHADIRAHGPVNIVIDGVQQLGTVQLSDGAAAYLNKQLRQGGVRGIGVRPFSLTAAYERAGLPVTDEMAFYDLCATDQEHIVEADCTGYDGSPLHATHETVSAAREVITTMVPNEKAIAAALAAIARIPTEYQREREILGALLSRRLMITALSQPWGPGALSPVSLLNPQVFTSDAQSKQAVDLLEQMLKRAEALAAHDLTILGSFGSAFQERVSSLRRLHDRVARMRSVRLQPRWAPFLAQLFRDTQTFITTGHQPW